jgi:hypothetical protein
MKETPMRVTVYHNIARDDAGHQLGFDGYQPGHPLVAVFTYDANLLNGGPPELLRIAEAAFEAFNADPEMLAGAQRKLATRYRRRALRSLSVGDVLLVGDTALACDPVGFREVPGDLNEVRVSAHGTHPISGP